MKRRNLVKALMMIVLITLNLKLEAQNWLEDSKVVASDRAANDEYGSQVAIDGNYAVVGAPKEDEDASGFNSLNAAGAAYVLEKNSSGNWVEKQKIVAPLRAAGDNFGASVSISGDYIVIGAPKEDEDASEGTTKNASGSVYVFERDVNGNWNFDQKIVANDRSANDQFGSVSISNNTIVVGSPNDDRYGTSNAGSIYIYDNNSQGNWIFTQKIQPSDLGVNSNYGLNVSISNSFIAVHCKGNGAFDIPGTKAGAIYLYENHNQSNWSLKTKINPSSSSLAGGLYDQRLLASISLEGDYLVYAIPTKGKAVIHKKNSSGAWPEVQEISNSGINFGSAVSFNSGILFVGAENDNTDENGQNSLSNAGSVFIYNENSPGVWSLDHKIVPLNRTAGAKYGSSISSTLDQFIVGSPYEPYDEVGTNNLVDAGAVVINKLNPCATLTLSTSKSTKICDQDIKVFITATPQGGTAPYFYNWSNGLNTETFSTTTTGQFDVTITDNNGCTLTDQIQVYDSDFRNIQLKLIREDCGRTALDPLEAQLNYETVNTATNYRYRINGGSMVDVVKNSGNDDNFNLNQTPDFEVNQSYTIEIAAKINGDWTAFGPACSIATKTPAEIRLKLQNADCGRAGADPTATRLFFERRIDASQYEVNIKGPNGYDHSMIYNSGENSINLVHYPNIQYNTTYDVKVSAMVDGHWSAGGKVCQVTTADLQSRVNLTLRDEYCGKTNLDPDNARLDYFTRGGTIDPDHQIELKDPSGNIQILNTGQTSTTNLRHFSGVLYDATYEVRIRPEVDNVWASWGDVCTVKTARMLDVVNVKFSCVSCGKTGLNPNSTTTRIFYNRRRDATDHKVSIVGPGVNTVLNVGTSGAFYLSSISGLQYNATYTIKMAAEVNGIWSNYGDPCTISMRADPSLSPPPPARIKRGNGHGGLITVPVDIQASPQNNKRLQLFPNPNHSGQLNLQYQKQSEASNIQIQLFNIQGLEVFSSSIQQENKMLNEQLELDLPPGIYNVVLSEGNKRENTKLIIN